MPLNATTARTAAAQALLNMRTKALAKNNLPPRTEPIPESAIDDTAALFEAMFDAIKTHAVVATVVQPGTFIGHADGDPITGQGAGTGTIT